MDFFSKATWYQAAPWLLVCTGFINEWNVQHANIHLAVEFALMTLSTAIRKRLEGSDAVKTYASCPNCGQIDIDISPVPRNHGDQLLVHKSVFDFRRPRRWEPVVFRNPDGADDSVREACGWAAR